MMWNIILKKFCCLVESHRLTSYYEILNGVFGQSSKTGGSKFSEWTLLGFFLGHASSFIRRQLKFIRIIIELLSCLQLVKRKHDLTFITHCLHGQNLLLSMLLCVVERWPHGRSEYCAAQKIQTEPVMLCFTQWTLMPQPWWL